MSRKTILREKYNITSENYDELYAHEQLEKYMIAIRYSDLGAKILDSGCGTALFLEFINSTLHVNRISYYICLDLSPGMLEKARTRIRRLRLDFLVDIVEADAENLPLRSRSIDTSFSFTVINLLEDISKGVSELKRVTRSCITISVLKLAEKHSIYAIRFGKYIGETSKDRIFIECRRYSKPEKNPSKIINTSYNINSYPDRF